MGVDQCRGKDRGEEGDSDPESSHFTPTSLGTK